MLLKPWLYVGQYHVGTKMRFAGKSWFCFLSSALRPTRGRILYFFKGGGLHDDVEEENDDNDDDDNDDDDDDDDDDDNDDDDDDDNDEYSLSEVILLLLLTLSVSSCDSSSYLSFTYFFGDGIFLAYFLWAFDLSLPWLELK